MQKYLIVDVDLPKPDFAAQFATFGLTTLDCRTMTEALLGWEGWQQFNLNKTLLLFPGNGASILKAFVPDKWLQQWPWKANVHAKRHWIPGERPQAVANRAFAGVLVGIQNVVILDNVVSSGETARKLRTANLPWIPGADWHLVTRVAQKARALKGFTSSYAVCETGTKTQKVPINSLSTLLAEPNIATCYAERNFYEPNKFLGLLENCRKQYLRTD